MIQDIAPWRFGNEFLRVSPADGDTVLDLDAEGLLLEEETQRLPSVREWREWAAGTEAELVYAFRLVREDDAFIEAPMAETDSPEGRRALFFLVLRRSGAFTPAGWRRTAPSALRGSPVPRPLVAATALHLAGWYDTHRFCGRCGSPMRRSRQERALSCPDCGQLYYPVIPPCVIVAVISGDRLLMTRYARPGASKLVLVAGFVEIGETAEQAAAREVMEEAGLRIRNLRYAGSQPWGLSGTLALGYVAELDGPDTIRLDTSELAEARWVERSAIPPCTDSSSLTMSLISRFAAGEL